MAHKKAGLSLGSVPRATVLAAFVSLSLLTFLLSPQVASTAVLQLAVLLSYGALLTGIILRLPDAEVLAWLILGTAALVFETEYSPGAYWLAMASSALVVLAADLDHSVAILYSLDRNESVGVDQAASRRQLLLRRIGRLGASAAAALLLALVGTSLAPPLFVAGGAAAVIGIFGAAALALLTAVVWIRRSD